MTFWTLIGLLLLVAFVVGAVSSIVKRVTVFDYQHAVRFDSGRVVGTLTPGAYWILMPLTRIEILDARPKVVTIPGQEVLSSDGVSLKISLIVGLRIADPKSALLQATSYEDTLYVGAQVALRSAIGGKPIEEVLETRDEISTQLRAQVQPLAEGLGLELESIAVKDIMFPGSLKEAFSQAARAKQQGKATLERARGETAALRNLANAARAFEGNPQLFQLRLLQAVSDAGKLVLTIAAPDATRGNDESRS